MRAAIVGCGIGGMASAIALARRGVDVTLFEAFDTPRPLGSGLLLQPSGLAALRALGLEARARASGAMIARLDGRDLRGRRILDLDYQAWRPGSHGVGIHRAALFDLLHGEMLAQGVTLVCGAPIETVRDWVRPSLIDAAGRAHGPFDLAVIADGSASRLRSQLRPRARAAVYPWGAVWADAWDEPGDFDGALLQIYHRAEIMIGVLPVGRGADPQAARRVSLFWSLPVSQMDPFFSGDFDAWRARVLGWRPDLAPLVSGLAGAHAFSRAIYRDVAVGRWSRGACVLIGDAAHGTSPQLGQGANLALCDAVELAAAIERPARSVGARLDAYQRSRRRHTALYQLASRALTPLFQSGGGFGSWIRDWLFVPATRLPGAKAIAGAVLAGVARLGPWPRIERP